MCMIGLDLLTDDNEGSSARGHGVLLMTGAQKLTNPNTSRHANTKRDLINKMEENLIKK